MPHISDPLTAEEYILVDYQVVSEEQMTDEEIIRFVNGEESQEAENNEESENDEESEQVVKVNELWKD